MKLFVVANYVMACCWSVPRLPAPGETLLAHDFTMEPGGKGLNVAIAAKRLGMEVSALLGIGDDPAAEVLLSLLHDEDLDTRHVYRFAGASGHGSGLISANGQNAIAVFPGTNLLLDASHAETAREAIANAAAVYGHFETSLPVVQRCFELAHQQDRLTVLNPSPWQPIPAALLAVCDVLIVNEVEAMQLLHCSGLSEGDLSACDALLAPRVAELWQRWSGTLLVVTLGARGCIAFRKDQPSLAQAGFVVNAVDTVGAGDAFAAGLLRHLVADPQGKAELETALRYANACGALLAGTRGVLNALPNTQQVDAFCAEHTQQRTQ